MSSAVAIKQPFDAMKTGAMTVADALNRFYGQSVT
jgi:hypothetical protein